MTQEAFRQLGEIGDQDILIVVDHASNHVPPDIDLGIERELLLEHIAWDIGVGAIAEHMAAKGGMAALLQERDAPDAMIDLLRTWRPRLVATLNGQEVKLAKLEGAFVWHKHDEEDELFLCVEGRLRIEMRERSVELEPGELFVVPKGVEHRPVAEPTASVLLFEPAGVRNTGDVEHSEFTALMA